MSIGNRIISAVGAMPFAGRRVVQQAYRSGLEAAGRGDRPGAMHEASFLRWMGRKHVPPCVISAAVMLENIVFAASFDVVAPAHVVAAGIAGTYAVANAGVVYTQTAMASRLRAKAETMPPDAPINTSPNQRFVPELPTRVERCATDLGHYSLLASVMPTAFTMGWEAASAISNY